MFRKDFNLANDATYIAICNTSYPALVQTIKNLDLTKDGNEQSAIAIYNKIARLLGKLFTLIELYDDNEIKISILAKHLLHQGASILQYLNRLTEPEALLIQCHYMFPRHKLFPQDIYSKLNFSLNVNADINLDSLPDYIKIATMLIETENIEAFSRCFIRKIFNDVGNLVEIGLVLPEDLDIKDIFKSWSLYLVVSMAYVTLDLRLIAVNVMKKAFSLAPTVDSLKLNFDAAQFYFEFTHIYSYLCLEYPSAQNIFAAKKALQNLQIVYNNTDANNRRVLCTPVDGIKIDLISSKLSFLIKDNDHSAHSSLDVVETLKWIDEIHGMGLFKDDAYLSMAFFIFACNMNSQSDFRIQYYDHAQMMLGKDLLNIPGSSNDEEINKEPILILFAIEVIMGKVQLHNDNRWLPNICRTSNYTFDETTEKYLKKKLQILLYFPFDTITANKLIRTLHPSLYKYSDNEEISFLYNEIKVKYSCFQSNLYNSIWHTPNMVSSGDISIKCETMPRHFSQF